MMVDKTRVAHVMKLERGIPCLRVNRFGLSPVRISNLKCYCSFLWHAFAIRPSELVGV
jgi:hypothetical protein